MWTKYIVLFIVTIMRMSKHNYLDCFKATHNDKYDYTEALYTTAQGKVKIWCKYHKSFFHQRAYCHYQGGGCPDCRVHSIKVSSRQSELEVITKLTKIHKGRYTYEHLNYKNAASPITVTCAIHGDFKTPYTSHYTGNGCTQCYLDSKKGCIKIPWSEVLKRFTAKHGSKYSYDERSYTGTKGRVVITCPIHGKFKQYVNDHILGKACRSCGLLARGQRTKMTLPKVLARFKEAHTVEYNYTKVIYKDSHSKVIIGCPVHGEFHQTPISHWQGHGCASCANSGASTGELELRAFIEGLGDIGEVISGDRTILDGREIDIYIPKFNLGIEFDGIYWHSAKYKDKTYHLDKLAKAKSKGVRLIFVREDEWAHKPHIIRSLITNMLGKNTQRIYARKCALKSVSPSNYRTFCNNNHLQGYTPASFKLGLYYMDELVAVIGVTTPRVGVSMLARFVVKNGVSVVGGLSRLVHHWGNPLETFCDNRMFTGGGYISAGFELLDEGAKPDLWFANRVKVVSRNAMTKPAMRKRWGVIDENKTQEAIARDNGWYALRYCGNKRLRWEPS